jgi:hypothetical protein
MQSLLNISAFYYSNPAFYRISRISEVEYYIEPKDRNIRSFTLRKRGSNWLAEGGYTDFHAAQLGEIIEKQYRGARRS